MTKYNASDDICLKPWHTISILPSSLSLTSPTASSILQGNPSKAWLEDELVVSGYLLLIGPFLHIT